MDQGTEKRRAWIPGSLFRDTDMPRTRTRAKAINASPDACSKGDHVAAITERLAHRTQKQYIRRTGVIFSKELKQGSREDTRTFFPVSRRLRDQCDSHTRCISDPFILPDNYTRINNETAFFYIKNTLLLSTRNKGAMFLGSQQQSTREQRRRHAMKEATVDDTIPSHPPNMLFRQGIVLWHHEHVKEPLLMRWL